LKNVKVTMIFDIFSSFFSSYILLSITTLVILLGSIYLYINHRMSDQDHKLTSVVNVLQGIIYDTQVIKSQLIGGGSQEEPDANEGNVDDVVVELDQNDTESKIVVSDCEYSDSDSNMSSDSDSTVSATFNANVTNVELDIDEVVPTALDIDVAASAVLDIDVAASAVLDIDETNDDLMEVKTNDFKKMSVGALREMIQEKGLCADPSKLKKQDLVQLLV